MVEVVKPPLGEVSHYFFVREKKIDGGRKEMAKIVTYLHGCSSVVPRFLLDFSQGAFL